VPPAASEGLAKKFKFPAEIRAVPETLVGDAVIVYGPGTTTSRRESIEVLLELALMLALTVGVGERIGEGEA
jgi:hypothetical protein